MSEHSSPEQIQPVRFVEEARYLPHEGREIRPLPQSLIGKRIRASVRHPPRNRVLSTCLIGLSIEDNLLSIDGSPDQAINRARTLPAAIDHSSPAAVCRYLNKHSPGATVATGSRSPSGDSR